VVPAVGTGTVMEDALEPSLGASNSIVATPEKAWLQRLNQLQKRSVVNLFYCFFIRIYSLLVFSDDSNDGKFYKQSKTKAKGISNAIVYGFSIIVIYVLLGF
jgi:thiol:disulfide interchange protein DsbD